MRRASPLFLAAALALAVPAATAAPPEPARVVTSFRAVLTTPLGSESVVWRSTGLLAVRPIRGQAPLGSQVEARGVVFYGKLGPTPGTVIRRPFVVKPDGYTIIGAALGATDYVLGEARSGRAILKPASLGGRPALRARVALHANDCAGLRAGTQELWLDRSTLLPLRVQERGGGRERSSFRFSYSSLGIPAKPGDFRAPPLGRPPFRIDQRFTLASPAAAKARLPYAPRVPAWLPRGFALSQSGWAPKSARTGPEASNPRYPSLFAAVYRRGLERIDVTQRVATGAGGWPGDPFGAECGWERTSTVSIGGARGMFGTGPAFPPHLWWRDGNLLLTVSGPLSRRELLRVAASLAPVS